MCECSISDHNMSARYDLREGEATRVIYTLVSFFIRFRPLRLLQLELKIKECKYREAIDVLNYQAQINTKVKHFKLDMEFC